MMKHLRRGGLSDVYAGSTQACQKGCSGNSAIGQCLPDGSGYETVSSCSQDEQCENGSCNDCVPNDYRGCIGDSVYWYDSCGRTGDLIETCGSGEECSLGVCEISSTSCDCSCTCSFCTATVSSTCYGSSTDCTSCSSICQDTCTSDPMCGSYISSSGSCG
jgi:hypothetical protein